MSVRILALVGSLRAGSHNRQLAEAAVKHAPEGVEIELFEGLADVPFYNEDLDVEGDVPAAAARLRAAAGATDAFLLVSPEYNGTIPAVLKNAIDWLSRPYGAGALSGKPVAVVGTAFGQFGGVWAQDDTRKAAGIAGGTVLEDVKLSIPGSVTRFAELHPADDAEVVEGLTKVIEQLSAQAGTSSSTTRAPSAAATAVRTRSVRRS
ncbi:NAD(P)H-dependent oxidoreductase, partial [Streptomyces avermitilis]|uniref:NAD(P)H-dependent oxidoreductase n=1 Tax=Streptomyces avermitilis TaxID=33903 RepID=UPI0033A4832D